MSQHDYLMRVVGLVLRSLSLGCTALRSASCSPSTHMFSTPSKLSNASRDPRTHLIINQGSSDSEEFERRELDNLRESSAPPALDPLDDQLSDTSDSEIGIPVFKFGASASETQRETQSLVVTAFHKVLSVLRQYVHHTLPQSLNHMCLILFNFIALESRSKSEDAAESIKTNLGEHGKQIVPLLEELTYFLEQYHFTPSLLAQNIKLMSKQHLHVKRKDDETGSLEDRGLPSNFTSSVPAYDYETLGMIMSEAHSLSLSLKMGLSTTAWLSAVSSINGAVLGWLTHLYRIPSHLSASFVDNLQLSRQELLRTALLTHFPEYISKGYRAFGSTLPVVICTHLVPWIQTLVNDVGLPQESIRVGPTAIEEIAENEVVVVVLWVLPDPTEPITWSDAQTDALISYVQKSGVWLHAEGYDTVLMTSLPDPSGNVIAQIADSLVVDASELVQVERYPSPTLFYRATPRRPPTIPKEVDMPAALITPSETLHLELWFATQLKGRQILSQLVSLANLLSEQLYRKISTNPYLKVLEPGDKSNSMLHIRFEMPAVFSHDSSPIPPLPSISEPESSNSATDEQKDDANVQNISTVPSGTRGSYEPLIQEDERATEYIFRFILNSSPTPLPLELRRLHADGQLYILWDPLRCYHLQHLARGHIYTLADMLTRQASIIASTWKCRDVFDSEVLKHSNRLSLVHAVPLDPVGLGAVQYHPEFVSVLEAETGKEAERWAPILDELNASILGELLQIYPLYYSATTEKGAQCLGIHLDSTEMTPEKVEYHVQIILETASRIEGESSFLERVGELVKEGIQEAKDAIERSKVQRTAQKGIVRTLPLVGRVWNWWSPYKAPSEGTSYDLLSGVSNEKEL